MSVVALARVVREELEDVLHSAEAGILGGVPDLNEYHRLCGKRQGLLQAISILDEQVSRMEQQD